MAHGTLGVALVACASTTCSMLAAVALVSRRPATGASGRLCLHRRSSRATCAPPAAAARPTGRSERAHQRLGRSLPTRPPHRPGIARPAPCPARTPRPGLRSQEGQDKWVDRHVVHGRRGGVFVDLGCYDGVTYSNTWYFEKQLGWSGVCVEPNPGVFPRIAEQAGRTSGVQVAVSDHEGSAMFVAAYMRSSLNESAVDYDFLAQQGVSADRVATKVVTPERLLSDHLPKVSTIEYVNIDVESQELAILRVWPGGRVCVDVFTSRTSRPTASPPSSARCRSCSSLTAIGTWCASGWTRSSAGSRRASPPSRRPGGSAATGTDEASEPAALNLF